MTTLMTIEISMNGEQLQTGARTLEALLLARGYALKTAMACAVNNAFVPRAQWPAHALQDGDRIDVVMPITGG